MKVPAAVVSLLLVCVIAAPARSYAGDPSAATAVPDFVVQRTISNLRTVIVFSAVNLAGQSFDVGAVKLAPSFRNVALPMMPDTHYTTYSVHLPAIERALNVDQTVVAADVTPPITVPSQGKKLAGLIGADGYLLTSVDEQVVDTALRSVSVHATFSLYCTASPDPLRKVSVVGEAIANDPLEDMTAIEDRAYLSAARRGFDGLYPGVRIAHLAKNSHRK